MHTLLFGCRIVLRYIALFATARFRTAFRNILYVIIFQQNTSYCALMLHQTDAFCKPIATILATKSMYGSGFILTRQDNIKWDMRRQDVTLLATRNYLYYMWRLMSSEIIRTVWNRIYILKIRTITVWFLDSMGLLDWLQHHGHKIMIARIICWYAL